VAVVDNRVRYGRILIREVNEDPLEIGGVTAASIRASHSGLPAA
jgi:hypothetical protein